MDDEEVVDKHESYGMVGMNCVSGETRLFGSQALHHSFLRFEVRHAEMRRQHSYDRPVADSMPVIEFDISHAALAQLITNPGRGYGVPCTLRRVEDSFNEHMEDEVNKAITELEGARGHMISQLGLEAFAATAEQQLPEFTLMKAPLLGDGKKK